MHYIMDKNLSLAAKGLLTMMFELQKKNKRLIYEVFEQHSKETRLSYKQLLKDLAVYGYVDRERKSNGKIYYDYELYRESQLSKYFDYDKETVEREKPISPAELKKKVPKEYFYKLWFKV